MLLKYLNELDAAVLNAKANPDQSHLKRCFECVDVLENYLQGRWSRFVAKVAKLCIKCGQKPRAIHRLAFNLF